MFPTEGSELCFNPTLVRLRLVVRNSNNPCGVPFQSHAGSIEARHKLDQKPPIHCVSIPRWFD